MPTPAARSRWRSVDSGRTVSRRVKSRRRYLPVMADGGRSNCFRVALREMGGARPSDVVPPLKAQSGGTGRGDGAPLLATWLAVRRFTARECERLQGLPDDYTLIPVSWEARADGPRYRAIGNSHGGAGDAVDRAADSDRGQHWWLKRASRPRWRSESRSGRSTGWCRTREMPARIRTSRWRRLPRASRSSASTTRSWWTPTPASSPATDGCWPRESSGLEQVPVVVLDHLSETQKRAYIIADNRIARTRDGMTRSSRRNWRSLRLRTRSRPAGLHRGRAGDACSPRLSRGRGLARKMREEEIPEAPASR